MDMKATFAVVNYTSSYLSTKGIIDVPFMFADDIDSRQKLFQLYLVVSYSDASASPPGFTVTDSIFIGRQGWYLETSAGTSDHE
jgi:hypothetical protein